MYKSDTIGVHTVTYCAPVKKQNGANRGCPSQRDSIGILSWILLMRPRYTVTAKVYLLNSVGLVIASQDNREILKKILVSLKPLSSRDGRKWIYRRERFRFE